MVDAQFYITITSHENRVFVRRHIGRVSDETK